MGIRRQPASCPHRWAPVQTSKGPAKACRLCGTVIQLPRARLQFGYVGPAKVLTPGTFEGTIQFAVIDPCDGVIVERYDPPLDGFTAMGEFGGMQILCTRDMIEEDHA